MKHPPYHLRPNKAADRFVFFNLLRRYENKFGFDKHQYLGFGGPFMGEFAEIARSFPRMQLNCVEDDKGTHIRQKFHTPKKGIRFVHSSLKGYVEEHLPSTVPFVAWLDFVKMSYQNLASLELFLQGVATPSIIRVTVPVFRHGKVNPTDIAEETRESLGKYVPDTVDWKTLIDFDNERNMSFDAIQKVARIALPPGGSCRYEPLHESFYKDGVAMISVTGIVGHDLQVSKAMQIIENWDYAGRGPGERLHLDCPTLSMKERMHLEPMLPSKNGSITPLSRRLGYLIDENNEKHKKQLANYHKFHQAYPIYGKFSV